MTGDALAVDLRPYWTKPPSKKVRERLEKIADLLSGTVRTVRNIAYALYPDLHGKELDNAYNVTVKDVVRARIMGLVDWDSIRESRCTFKNLQGYSSVDSFWKAQELDALWEKYCLDRRPAHIHNFLVWFEKETVIKEIGDTCTDYDVPWVCGRGQATWSIKKTLADFMDGSWTVLYMGDNDEKGLEIYEVIRRDLRFLGCRCEVEWVAITDQQADIMGIPRDSRLDGMDLTQLENLTEKIILEHIDEDKLKEIEEQEAKDIEYLKAFKLKIVDKEGDE